MQMKKQELDIKQAEVQRKTQKDASDTAIKKQEQDRKTKKDMVDARLETEQLKLNKAEIAIDAQKAGAKMEDDARTNKNKLELEVLKTIKGK